MKKKMFFWDFTEFLKIEKFENELIHKFSQIFAFYKSKFFQKKNLKLKKIFQRIIFLQYEKWILIILKIEEWEKKRCIIKKIFFSNFWTVKRFFQNRGNCRSWKKIILNFFKNFISILKQFLIKFQIQFIFRNFYTYFPIFFPAFPI